MKSTIANSIGRVNASRTMIAMISRFLSCDLMQPPVHRLSNMAFPAGMVLERSVNPALIVVGGVGGFAQGSSWQINVQDDLGNRLAVSRDHVDECIGHKRVR